MRLNGKTAIVTGTSRGIGRAIALTLAREGVSIVLFLVSSIGDYVTGQVFNINGGLIL